MFVLVHRLSFSVRDRRDKYTKQQKSADAQVSITPKSRPSSEGDNYS